MYIVLLLWLAALILCCSLLVEVRLPLSWPPALHFTWRLPVFGGFGRPHYLHRRKTGQGRQKPTSAFIRAFRQELLSHLSWQQPQLIRARRRRIVCLSASISGACLLRLAVQTAARQLRGQRSRAGDGQR